MTGGAALFKGGMNIVADQALCLAAMGVVAGEACPGFPREALMARQGLRLTMTAQTERIIGGIEKLVVVSMVWLMTGPAIASGKRRMLNNKLLGGQRLMAAKTALSKGPP